MRPIRLLPFLLLASCLIEGVAASPAQARVRGKEFHIPTAYSSPNGITAGPDGALRFTESHGNKVGRVTTGGPSPSTPSPPRAATLKASPPARMGPCG
jgi:hypothetical protein